MVAPLIVVSLGVSVVGSVWYHAVMVADMQRGVLARAGHTAAGLSQAAGVVDSRSELQSIATRVGLDPDIADAIVIGPAHRVVAASRPDRVGLPATDRRLGHLGRLAVSAMDLGHPQMHARTTNGAISLRRRTSGPSGLPRERPRFG